MSDPNLPDTTTTAPQTAVAIATSELPAVMANGIHPEDPDDEWLTQRQHIGIKLRAPTVALLALAILAAGFWSGALAAGHQKSAKSTTASAAAAKANKKAARNAGSATSKKGLPAGNAASPGAAGGATNGLLTRIQGQTLYLIDGDGNLVKVDVGPSATINRTTLSSMAGLQNGDTVTVRGTIGANGAITANSVIAQAQGVQSVVGSPG
jgi:hypothetical protein